MQRYIYISRSIYSYTHTHTHIYIHIHIPETCRWCQCRCGIPRAPRRHRSPPDRTYTQNAIYICRYMYINMYVYVYKHPSIFLSIHLSIFLYIYISIYIYRYTNTPKHIYMYIYVCLKHVGEASVDVESRGRLVVVDRRQIVRPRLNLMGCMTPERQAPHPLRCGSNAIPSRARPGLAGLRIVNTRLNLMGCMRP